MTEPSHFSAASLLPVLLSMGACNTPVDVHRTLEARDEACVSCHSSAFALAASPQHAGAFPETCGTCHNTIAWSPATLLDHPWFALDGKHALAPCGSCHTGSPARYAGTPSTCAECHLADFQNAALPGHSAFPPTCQDCHSPAGWAPARAHPEDRFPIHTGAHANPAIACSDCHDATRGSPVMGQNTDCIHCHLGAHTRPTIDAVHTAFGAAYPGPNASAPSFCLGCHPTG